MTTFTTIPNSSLEPGKPIRSIDGLALRDNPIAMFEGDPTAPKLAAAGLQTGTNERDWVLARTAAAAVGAVGSYACLRPTFANTTTNISSSYGPGTTHAGSSLRYSGTGTGGTTAPAGTWRALGEAWGLAVGEYSFYYYGASTVFLRIS